MSARGGADEAGVFMIVSRSVDSTGAITPEARRRIDWTMVSADASYQSSGCIRTPNGACSSPGVCHEGDRMETERSLVSVVDDDESVRESLPDLLRELGFAARAFSSAEEFLASDCIGETRCLILDIAMPGMSGPGLQRELTRRRREIPIVFITAHRDDAARPGAIERGAVECLFKPFSESALLDALNAALRAGT
jgi:CheY-like chemotaxis protein